MIICLSISHWDYTTYNVLKVLINYISTTGDKHIIEYSIIALSIIYYEWFLFTT